MSTRFLVLQLVSGLVSWAMGYYFGVHMTAKQTAIAATSRYGDRVKELIIRKRLTAHQGLEVLCKDEAEYKSNGGI